MALLQNINPDDNLIFQDSPIGYIYRYDDAAGVYSLDSSGSHFAAALRFFLRKENRPKEILTQEEVGRRVGKSQSFIGKLSRGEMQGREATRREIASIYGYDGSEPGRMYDDFLKFGKRLLEIAAAHGYDDFEPGQAFKDFLDFRKKQIKKGKIDPVPTAPQAYKIDNAAQEVRQSETVSYLKDVSARHKCIVDAFRDKETAFQINAKLLELEKHDPKAFEAIKKYIDYAHAELQAKKIANGNSE